jgi:hypothetical protein
MGLRELLAEVVLTRVHYITRIRFPLKKDAVEWEEWLDLDTLQGRDASETLDVSAPDTPCSIIPGVFFFLEHTPDSVNRYEERRHGRTQPDTRPIVGINKRQHGCSSLVPMVTPRGSSFIACKTLIYCPLVYQLSKTSYS